MPNLRRVYYTQRKQLHRIFHADDAIESAELSYLAPTLFFCSAGRRSPRQDVEAQHLHLGDVAWGIRSFSSGVAGGRSSLLDVRDHHHGA